MPQKLRKPLMAIALVAAAALGGSALAGAAQQSSSSSSSQGSNQTQSSDPQGRPPGGPGGANGGHVGKNGQRETLLTGDTAAKVKAAALAKVSGTLERVETDADHGSPYEAHVRKADGTELEVLVNKDFQVTAVNTLTR
jgi:uncharacterized membrane protein YkoI